MELIIENNTARVQKQYRNDDGAYCTGTREAAAAPAAAI